MTPLGFPILWFLALPSGFVALHALLKRRPKNAALIAFVITTIIADSAPLVWPAVWTPGFIILREWFILLFGGVAAGLIAHRLFSSTPRAAAVVRRCVLGGFLLLAFVALYASYAPIRLRSAYRLLVVGEASVALLCASVIIGCEWYEIDRSTFDHVTLWGLFGYFFVMTLYLGAWEVVPVSFALVLGVVNTLMYTGAMFAIATAALREEKSP